MNSAKQILITVLCVIAFILLLPLILLGAILYALWLPIDVIRYYRSPFWRDTQEKYKSEFHNAAVLYNRAVRQGLDWRFVRNDKINYFIREGEVLLYDLPDEMFLHDSGWHLDYGAHAQLLVTYEIEEERRRLNDEDKNKVIRILRFEDRYEMDDKLRQCPYFYFVPSSKRLR